MMASDCCHWAICLVTWVHSAGSKSPAPPTFSGRGLMLEHECALRAVSCWEDRGMDSRMISADDGVALHVAVHGDDRHVEAEAT